MDPTTVRWLIFAGAALVLLWLAVTNAAQAWLLHQRRVPVSRASRHVGQAVALSGPLHLVEPVVFQGTQCLYYDSKTQEYRRRHGKATGHWQTVATRTNWATFGVKQGDVVVLVVDEPSEVHGTTTRNQTHHDARAGFLGFLTGYSGSTREVTRLLTPPREVTVVGQLRQEGTLVLGRDPRLGLLISPYPAGRVALQESLKAGAALVGIGVVWWFLFRLPAL